MVKNSATFDFTTAKLCFDAVKSAAGFTTATLTSSAALKDENNNPSVTAVHSQARLALESGNTLYLNCSARVFTTDLFYIDSMVTILRKHVYNKIKNKAVFPLLLQQLKLGIFYTLTNIDKGKIYGWILNRSAS